MVRAAAIDLRAAGTQDRGRLAVLFQEARWKHLHLDWFDPLDLLPNRPFLLAFHDQDLVACLAIPPDPPGVSWLRAFAVAGRADPAEVWDRLWPEARRRAQAQGVRDVAAIVQEDWLAELLHGAGFEQPNEVVFLEWRRRRPPAPPRAPGTLRAMAWEDLASVVEVDGRAFAPPWRLSLRTLQAAYRQARLSTVVEEAGRIVGYQVTTASPLGAHLARLAVDPEGASQGIGTWLVVDVLQRLSSLGYGRVSVNTQSDNERGMALYRRLGFKPIGPRFPVYHLRLDAEGKP